MNYGPKVKAFCGSQKDFRDDYGVQIPREDWVRAYAYGTSSYEGHLGYHVPGIILRTPPKPVDLSLNNRFLPRDRIIPFSLDFTWAMDGKSDKTFEEIYKNHTIDLLDSNL